MYLTVLIPLFQETSLNLISKRKLAAQHLRHRTFHITYFIVSFISARSFILKCLSLFVLVLNPGCSKILLYQLDLSSKFNFFREMDVFKILFSLINPVRC